MLKKIFKRVRLNFRKSASDRKATLSYRNYHQQFKQFLNKTSIIQNFKQANKEKGNNKNG